MSRIQPKYDDEFKKSIVSQRESGKTLGELKCKYGGSESAVNA
jgi:transposase-like protein